MVALAAALAFVTASEHGEHTKARPPDVVTPDGELARVLAPERDTEVGEEQVATPSLRDLDFPVETAVNGQTRFGIAGVW